MLNFDSHCGMFYRRLLQQARDGPRVAAGDGFNTLNDP